MCTGWTWEYVGEHVDLPRLAAMKEYWEENPPLHLMIKAFLGLEGKKAKEEDRGDMAELLATIPQRG